MIMKSTVFWYVTPCSLVEVHRENNMKQQGMEVTYSSETSVDFQRTTHGVISLKIDLIITIAVRTIRCTDHPTPSIRKNRH
jgi:hypothetical protein